MDQYSANSKVELLYVWVKKYKKLENIGFNLSNKFKIEYDEKLNTILIDENANFVPDLFEYPAV